MATVQQTLSNPLYENWVKGGLVFKFTRDGLQCFVQRTVQDFQIKCLNDIRTRKGLPLDTVCHLCTTQNVLTCRTDGICKDDVRGQCKYHDHNDPLKTHKPCPSAICNDLRDEIAKSHRFHGPSWRNTDALLWCSSSWQIAKCFMAADGYSLVSSAEETDFLGLVSVVINLNYVQTMVKDDLSQKNNLFSQARTIRNAMMHTSSYELTDEVLNGYIDTMIRLLNDPVYLASDKHAQSSITKLNQIKTMKVTHDHERVIREEALKAIDEKKEEAIQAAKREMQTELMNLYKEHYIKESILPHRPEEEDTDINEIYVEPHMELVDLQPKLKTDKTYKKIIHSYKDIFYTDSNLCKRIYFAGKAGMGKTTFCKRLISSWCNAHSNLPTSQVCNEEQGLTKNTSDSHTEVTKFIDNGTDTLIGNKHIMLNFAFLFYVSLRHACRDSEIEDMIKNQLLLQKKHKSLLTDILEKEPEQCLIILDGLDEWSPPESHHQSLPYVTKELPARSTTFRCSILTTTRPWKLDVLKLRTPEIDKQVECLGIDNAAAIKCIKYVIAILNNRRGQIKNPEDFVNELYIRNLNDIKQVPLLLKQLICLWHAGKSFGNSKCTLYSEMINLMLELAETHRLQDSIELSKIKEKSQSLHLCLPKCFDGVKFCHEFRSLIYSLSDLSFKTLMKKNEESTLVFDSSVVEIYGLSKYEIDICLKVGILSQSKVISAECTRQKSFSFIHKTFQDFFAATFVSMSSDSSDEFVKTICSKINTVDGVFQQSEFLVFVSGMCPKILYKLTEHICKVASCVATEYRQIIPLKLVVNIDGYNIKTPTRQISELMTQCLLESINNGYKNISIKMEDAFFNDYSPSSIGYGHVIESLTPVHIKSVTIDMITISFGLMETFLENIRHSKCLQKAVFISYDRIADAIVCILEHSKDTLCSLSIRGQISSKMLTTANYLKNLISLGLNNCDLSHDDLTYLYNYVTNTTQLQYISLDYIKCRIEFSSHCETQQDTNLDLSNHRQLIGLDLRNLSHVSTVAVNTSKLQLCNIDMEYMKCIKDAPNLYWLDCYYFKSTTMGQSLVITLPTLILLKRVFIYGVDFGDSELHLSADMKNLENVYLISCTMTSKVLRGFVDSIPYTALRVYFEHLGITPSSENDRCLEYIKSCPRFKVIHITTQEFLKKTDKLLNGCFVKVTFSLRSVNEEYRLD